LWRGVRAHGHGRLDHERHGLAARAAPRDACVRDRAAVPAWLAVRVAGDHSGLPADLLPGGRRAEARALAELRHPARALHGLVRRTRRRDDADRVSLAAGGDVGLLS